MSSRRGSGVVGAERSPHREQRRHCRVQAKPKRRILGPLANMDTNGDERNDGAEVGASLSSAITCSGSAWTHGTTALSVNRASAACSSGLKPDVCIHDVMYEATRRCIQGEVRWSGGLGGKSTRDEGAIRSTVSLGQCARWIQIRARLSTAEFRNPCLSCSAFYQSPKSCGRQLVVNLSY